MMSIHDMVLSTAQSARKAYFAMASLDAKARQNILKEIHQALLERKHAVLSANKLDVESAEKNGIPAQMIDRLRLDSYRFDEMLDGLSKVALQNDPLGEILEKRSLKNGIELSKVRVSIGVIGIIYESRPNVTCEAAALCLKSGNSVILKGGSEAINSNRAICEAMQEALKHYADLAHAISFVDSTDRNAVRELLQLDGLVDLVIPRGGEQLIKYVSEWSRVPVIKHAKGVCHTFVDATANLEMALDICENAKCQRPSVCNAMETLLIHKDIAAEFLPLCVHRLEILGVEFRGDEDACRISPNIKPANENDWSAEFLDLILAVKIVGSVQDAIQHINKYGSGHSDAIITKSHDSSEKFLREVDSATVYVNASTRFTDGAQFEMGAEIGISTDKIHARGPMGATELTTYKWLGRGNGQVR